MRSINSTRGQGNKVIIMHLVCYSIIKNYRSFKCIYGKIVQFGPHISHITISQKTKVEYCHIQILNVVKAAIQSKEAANANSSELTQIRTSQIHNQET